MDQSLIAWMLSGGPRGHTPEDLRQRVHRTALNEAAAARATDPAGGMMRDLVGRWSRRDEAQATAMSLECCPA